MPGRGSLAEVLPESCRKLFGRAATGFREVDTVGWTGVSGREYAWRLCRSSPTSAETRSARIVVLRRRPEPRPTTSNHPRPSRLVERISTGERSPARNRPCGLTRERARTACSAS